MPIDPLDDAIETARRSCEEIRALLHEKEVELKALELAARLRPTAGRRSAARPSRAGQGGGNGKGRQVGAISKKWRAILQRTALMYPDGALPEELSALGRQIGLSNLRPRDARQRAEKYVTLGYFECVGERYRVTNFAKRRFGMDVVSDEAPSIDPQSGLDERESVNVDLE